MSSHATQVQIANSGFTVNSSQSYTLTITTTEPGAPTGVTAEPASATSIRLRWHPPLEIGGSAVTGYQYRLRTGTTWGSWTAAGSVTEREQLVTGLIEGDTYGFQMRAVNSSGNGLWSEVVTAVPAGVPGAPSLTARVTSTTSVRLSWTPPADEGASAITGYDYRVRTGTTWGNWIEIMNSADLTSYEVTGLTAGTLHQFRVRARNDVGPGATSGTAVITLPTEFHACSAASETGRIWTANMTVGTFTSDGATRYGWDAGADISGDALTDTGFSYGGDEYVVGGITLQGTSLYLGFATTGDIGTKATRDALTLHVGTADGVGKPLNLGTDGTLQSSDFVNLRTGSPGLSWNAGAVVCLAMTIEPPVVESIEFTSDPGADDTYAIGDTITATVTFDQPVDSEIGNVIGVMLEVGDDRVRADCFTGSNVTKTNCVWEVTEGTATAEEQGIGIPQNPFVLTGGSSITATGTDVDAVLTYAGKAPGDSAGHMVDGMRPTVVSAAARGTKLTLVWSEDLDLTALPLASAFSFTADMGTAPTVELMSIDPNDPKTLTLTVSSAFVQGTVYTLDYEQLSLGGILDTAGNEAEEFENQPITVITYDWEFTVTGAEVVEGGGSVTATATITGGGTPTSDVTVPLKWGDGSVATGLVRGAGDAGAITILAGQTTGSLAISAPEDDGDQVYHPPQTENLSASFVGVEIGSAPLTRRDNDAKPVATIAVVSPATEEGTVPTLGEQGGGIGLEVTLDRAFGVDAVIPFAVTGDTGALSGPSEPSFRISASETSQRKSILLAPDNQDKDGERSVTFTLETSQDFDHYELGKPSSATVRILDDDTPPGVPRNLTARPGASGQLRLTWEDPTDGGGGQPVVKYQIRGTVPVDTGWGDVADSGEGGANRNSRTLLNLTNGVAHTVEIRAVNGAELPGPAAAVTAIPLDAITVSFVHAEQSADEDGEVTVEVRLSSPPVGGTPVEVPIVARRGADLGSDEFSGVSDDVTFGANETSKSFTVEFIGDDDDELNETLTLEIGDLPDGYVAVSPSETVLTLEDDDLPIVTASFRKASATVIDEGAGIEVVVTLDEEPDREVVLPIVATRSSGLEADEYTGVPESVTFGPRTTEVGFTVQFVDDTVIEPDATLTLGFEATLPFRVLAGTPAAMAIALKNDDGAPAAPEGLTASSGHESVRLDWLAVANDAPVTRYEVQWQRAAGGSVSDWRDVGLETTWRVDGLTNDTEYIFRVRAVNAHGEGWWATVRGTPKERIFAIPDAPQNLGLTNEDSSRATLRWTPPKNAFDPERSASRLQGYRIEACRASCGEGARWHALVENTRSIATEWVHGVLAPGVIRENRYRVRAINLNGAHGPWSNVASLGPTVVDPDLLKVRALDPETLEMRFTVERNPDGKKFHLRYRVNGSGDDAWTARAFPLTRKGEYEWEPTGLEPSPFDGAPTLYQVEFDFSPDFDSAWKRTRWKQMPLEGTGSTVTPPQPGRDEPVRVEIDVNGDGRPDRNVHLSLAMGETKRYRLRLAPGRSCVDGQYQARATVVGYSGVGTRGGHPALVRYADGRDWAVLKCDGPFRPWTTVEVHAPSFAEHAVAAHERADLLLNGEWPIAWRHELYRDTQAAQSPEQGLGPTSRLAQWQVAVDATVTLPRAMAAPAGVTVREVPGRTRLRVDWQDVPGAVGYELQWRFGADPYDTDPRPNYQYNRVRRPASADRPVTLEFDGAVTRSFTVRVRAAGRRTRLYW